MIKILQAKDGQYYFVIRAKNYQILVTSETYRTLAGAKKGVAALKRALK